MYNLQQELQLVIKISHNDWYNFSKEPTAQTNKTDTETLQYSIFAGM
jgi:hypothetical protein